METITEPRRERTGSTNQVTFQREILSNQVISELSPLAELHFKEVSANQDIPLDINWQHYFTLEEMGMLRFFTVRTKKNRVLIGYALYFVQPNMRYQSSLQAVQDVTYIHPAWRGNGRGRELFAWCDEQFRAEGVQLVYHHVKAKQNWAPAILEPMGYQLVDLVYSRRLDV